MNEFEKVSEYKDLKVEIDWNLTSIPIIIGETGMIEKYSDVYKNIIPEISSVFERERNL